MKNTAVWAAILCLVSAISWGAMFPVANDAFHHIDPFLLYAFPLWICNAYFNCLAVMEGREASFPI